MSLEFDPQRYQRASPHQQEWGQRLIAELDLRGHERILDVGSGDGSLTRKLAAGVPRGSVLGLDASTQMVEAAQRLQEPNLRFVRKDILDADFREEFDVVFSSATLHWVKDHGRLLGVLYRAVKPGGVVRLSFAGAGNCSRLIATLQELMGEASYQMAFNGFVWPWYMPAVRLASDAPHKGSELSVGQERSDARVYSGARGWAARHTRLRQDQAAVQAAITERWSNGPVEGQVTHEQGFEAARLQIRRQHNLLRIHAGCRDGERSPS
jgi:trans-aconitate 2-methyltransferase